MELEIKKAAKENNKAVLNTLAKQLITLRKQKTRCYVANSQIGAVNNQAKVMHASSKISGAMSSTAKTLKDVNQTINPGKVMESMRDFERENTKMDMKSEISRSSRLLHRKFYELLFFLQWMRQLMVF